MDGQPKPSSQNDMNWAILYVVDPDYLKTMRISRVRGRFLEVNDDEHSPSVAVVDEVFAEKFFPQQEAVGKRINMDDNNGHSRPVEIVGVVKHVKQWGLDRDDTQKLRAELYFPFMQLPDSGMHLAAGGVGVAVRCRSNAAAQFETIQAALRRTDAEQTVYNPQTMEQVISDSLSAQRYSMFLLGSLATLALVLASVGIYGVVSFVVSQRTQEIGIRMALGAGRVDVLRLVLGHAIYLVLIGVGLGTLSAFGLTRLMSRLLYGISSSDPLTFAAVSILLGAVALLACSVPARRATRVDPMIALRYE
jgi:predicted permease